MRPLARPTTSLLETGPSFMLDPRLRLVLCSPINLYTLADPFIVLNKDRGCCLLRCHTTNERRPPEPCWPRGEYFKVMNVNTIIAC
jgi:hypothetical protein